MFAEQLEAVRRAAPLVHCITNYVTVNDCANILLACGASPIMADDPQEVEEIAALSQGLVLNIGTLNHHTVPAMRAAGHASAALGHPIVLDPVGAGASRLRTETARGLLRETHPAIVRGNLSEIRALAGAPVLSRGVDAAENDGLDAGGETLTETAAFVRRFAAETGAVAAVTGAVDIVTDGHRTFLIRNGHPMMRRVTGAGCQLSAMTAAYAAADPAHPLEAAAAAVCAMGVCGERAFARLDAADGNAAYRQYLIDAVYRLTPPQLEKEARCELYT